MKRRPILTIKQVRVIGAVASCASLARASEQLNASQSSLSRAIAEVEGKLGQRLFARGWTGMEPTSQGEIVIARCRYMMSSIQAAQEALEASGARIADLGYHLAWELLSAVSAIKATGSVSAAAEYLERTQPDISRALAKITTATGRPPFERTRSGMKATGDAVILADLHTKLLMDVMTMPEQLEALSDEVTGRVAVGLLPFSEQDIVVKVFGEMLSRHRHVRLQAVTGSYAALIDGLRQGELDFLIGPLREPPPYDVLEEQHLYDEFFAVIARADHRLAKGRRELKDLVGENWIVAPHGTPTRRYFEDLLIGQGLVPPSQTCEIVTFALAEQMVINSDAVGLLTYSDRKLQMISNRLKSLDLDLPENRRGIGLTFRKHQAFTPALEIFFNMLRKKALTLRTGG